MAVTVYGGDGTLAEAPWGRLLGLLGDDVAVGYDATPAGSLVADGVLVESTAVESFTHDAGSGNPRIDLIGFRISRSGAGATATKTVWKGAPNADPIDPTGELVKNSGAVYDIVLGRVRVEPGVGVFPAGKVTTIVPQRRRVLVYRAAPANNSTTFDTNESMVAAATEPKIFGVLDVPDPGWRWRPRITAQVKFAGLSGAGFGRLDVTDDGTSVAEARAPAKNDGLALLHHPGAPRSGASTFRLRMLPQQMAGEELATTPAYAAFTVEVEPV